MQAHETQQASESPPHTDAEPRDERLRDLALATIRKRREFVSHVLAYVTVNACLVAIWAVTGNGFFWPVFPLLGWGIGLFFHGWETYSAPITEERIAREIDRLRRRGDLPAPDVR